MSARITILGSGTSSGVPLVGCSCPTCTSSDPRDSRTRTSVLVECDGVRILIDTSSDFRQQMLRHNIREVDAVIFTHHHFDHISGFDDLRAFNFHTRRPVLCYATDVTTHNLKRIFAYAFGEGTTPGTAAPMVTMRRIEPGVTFRVNDLEILPVPLMHGPLEVMGFRIGSFAYCTDCNGVPAASMAMLEGLDVLVLDALRYTTHPTHFSLDESVALATALGAGTTYFTHIAHEMKHADVETRLPANIRVAYDGLALELP